MGRKILSVSLDTVLPALCRDDRGRVNAREALGLDPAHFPAPFVTCDGMPDDARIIDVLPNPAFTGCLNLLIESDTFPDVPAGCALSYMDVRFSCHTSYEAYKEMTAKAAAGITEVGSYADAVAAQPPADEPVVAKPMGREFI